MNTPTEPSLLPAAPAGSALSIVIIDDNPDWVETLKDLLVIFGHEVISADDGESGLDTIRLGRPDVVICDIGLPGRVDGYGVARALRKNPSFSKTFLIALTGYGQDKDVKKALASGFDVHMLKPVSAEQLQEQLQLVQIERQLACN
jgi:CheY-like chemotaxis protein